jgi:hypothetical protein
MRGRSGEIAMTPKKTEPTDPQTFSLQQIALRIRELERQLMNLNDKLDAIIKILKQSAEAKR